MNEYDIRFTKPKLNCKFCKKSEIGHTGIYIAYCYNKKNTKDLASMRIKHIHSKNAHQISCEKCNHFEAKNQLSLF